MSCQENVDALCMPCRKIEPLRYEPKIIEKIILINDIFIIYLKSLNLTRKILKIYCTKTKTIKF